MMIGYWIFALFCQIYLGCGVVWVCVWIYSRFFNKGKILWLKRALVVFGLTGISPPILYIITYTLNYATSHPTISRTSGSYQGSFIGEKDTLTLWPNGSFRQQFVAVTGKAYNYSGKWKLQTIGFRLFDLDDKDTVTFDKLIVHIDGTGKHQKARFALKDEQEDLDSSSICFSPEDPDEPTCFTRQN